MKFLPQNKLTRSILLALALGTTAIIVVGCGGGGGCASAADCSTSSTATTTTTTTQPTAAAVSVGIGTNGLLATATEELQYAKDYVVTVSDVNGKLIYTNKNAKNKEVFDFHMENTQQLVVKVKVPNQEDAVMQHVGCVSIMSGFKQ